MKNPVVAAHTTVEWRGSRLVTIVAVRYADGSTKSWGPYRSSVRARGVVESMGRRNKWPVTVTPGGSASTAKPE